METIYQIIIIILFAVTWIYIFIVNRNIRDNVSLLKAEMHKEIHYTVSIDAETIKESFKSINPRLKRVEEIVFVALYERGNKIYFKLDNVDYCGIITEVHEDSENPPWYEVKIKNKPLVSVFQSQITAWE